MNFKSTNKIGRCIGCKANDVLLQPTKIPLGPFSHRRVLLCVDCLYRATKDKQFQNDIRTKTDAKK